MHLFEGKTYSCLPGLRLTQFGSMSLRSSRAPVATLYIFEMLTQVSLALTTWYFPEAHLGVVMGEVEFMTGPKYHGCGSGAVGAETLHAAWIWAHPTAVLLS